VGNEDIKKYIKTVILQIRLRVANASAICTGRPESKNKVVCNKKVNNTHIEK
jgi:hypothetical protein